MKKIILFLTLSFIYFLSTSITVNARSDSFYEGEYINNIYMVRHDKSTNTKYYQQARVYRRTSDGKLAYCLQPFKVFDPNNNNYESISQLPNIDNNTLNRIIDIIGFGYSFPSNANDMKLYAVTQLMIWQAVEPNNEFYFTDKLNGNKINTFDQDINKINNNITASYTMPSFNNQTFYGVAGKKLEIKDTNNIVDFFHPDNNNIKINNNTITIEDTKEGCYNANFTRFYNHSSPILFYYNPNSQHLATIGAPYNRVATIKYCFNELTLKGKKIDKDTQSTTSKGEASLKGTVFTLYNKNMEKIKDLTLDENMEFKITSNELDLQYDTYYLKETKTGTGYLPNEKVYEINFTKEKPSVELVIENEVIKKEITLNKYYGDGNLMLKEPNINFEIYDINNNLVTTITTDEKGIAKITLPYGHYKIVQVNSTEGYTKVKPFDIFVNDTKKEYYYTINDYKIKEEKETPQIQEEKITIEVPNTGLGMDNYNILSLLVPTYIFVKKKYS